jgi:nucleotide-binding universal stress UspA family protein
MESIEIPAGSVVVGVDGSPTSRLALRWAADKARRSHEPLHVVHALETEVVLSPGRQLGTPERPADEDLVLVTAVELLSTVAPEVHVVPHSVEGFALSSLVAASRVAGTLVVGSRGRGAIPAVFLGSVSQQLVLHARCPVVIVRHGQVQPLPAGAPVVVGVDGSAGSEPAVGYAFAHAAETGSPLLAVHSWWWEPLEGVSGRGPWTGDWAQIAAQEEALLSESLAGWREKYPEVTVDPRSVRSDPVVELLEHAHSARLLVVGSRGRGGFKGLVLGSVSQRVLKRATCPVAVVHAEPPTGQPAEGAARAED